MEPNEYGQAFGETLNSYLDKSVIEVITNSNPIPPEGVAPMDHTLTYQTISNVASAMEYQTSSTLDLFEQQFENRYDIEFSSFINAFKADHPELVI